LENFHHILKLNIFLGNELHHWFPRFYSVFSLPERQGYNCAKAVSSGYQNSFIVCCFGGDQGEIRFFQLLESENRRNRRFYVIFSDFCARSRFFMEFE